jgi:hypothetical protein
MIVHNAYFKLIIYYLPSNDIAHSIVHYLLLTILCNIYITVL